MRPDKAAANAATTIVIHQAELEIPAGEGHLSAIRFYNDPPRVQSIELDVLDRLPQSEAKSHVMDSYFVALKVDNLEISQVASTHQLHNLLKIFASQPKRVVVSTQAPLVQHQIDCVYTHTLPVHQDLGLKLEGFPPKIASPVSTFSPLAPTACLGQFVDALVLPDGRPPLHMQSPGFTGTRVTQVLEETKHLEGRKLILKDLTVSGVNAAVKTRYNNKSREEDAGFDTLDGCCSLL